MPKIKQIEEDEDEFADDTDEDELETEDEEEIEEKPKSKLKIKPKEIKRRFGIVAPQNLKIIDVETNEVIGEGDYAIIQAVTYIIEMLERIETQIGAVLH